MERSEKEDSKGNGIPDALGMRSRNVPWIDAWKGWLILLVVVGHAAGAVCHMVEGVDRQVCRGVYFLIYSYHMPAFFFVSGWLWRDMGFADFIRKRTRRLLIPYFLVGLVSIVIFAMAGGAQCMHVGVEGGYYSQCVSNNGAILPNVLSLLQGGGWPQGQGFRYNSVLWFLPCMFTVQLLYWTISKFVESRVGWAAVVLGCFMGSVYISRSGFSYWPWGLSCAPAYLCYFIGGRLLCQWRRNRPFVVPWWLTFVLVGGHLLWVYVWIRIGEYGLVYSGVRMMTAFCGILASAAVVSRFSGRLMNVFCLLGVSSMSVMCWHKFFIVGVQAKIRLFAKLCQFGMIGTFLGGVLLTAGAIAFVYALTTACRLLAARMRLLLSRMDAWKRL